MRFLIINLLNEGGSFFMYTLLLLLLICIALIVKAFIKGDSNGKMKQLVSSISLFALVFGFLGQMMGLITAFDSIESFDAPISSSILAGGIKVALLSPSFGMFVFLVARVGIILLTIFNKTERTD